MKYNELISVIILNWNGKHHLKECIDSVLNQTYNNFEVIVVDNASTDGSQDFIKNNYPQVKILELDQNYGFCKGNNEGIKLAKGEYIVLLNNDTKADKNWLLNLYQCIKQDQFVGMCASKMVYFDVPQKIDSAGNGFSVCGAGMKIGHLISTDKFNIECYVFGACAGAAMYKRELLENVGLFDEDFFAIYEDIDLSFRAQLAGYKCKYAPNAIVYHKVNSTIGKLTDFYVFYGQRNAELVYLKNMPIKLIFKTIFHHIAYLILAFLYFTIKGKFFIFIKAKIDFFRNIKIILKKRRIIQQNKLVDDDYLYKLFDKKWLSTRIKGK